VWRDLDLFDIDNLEKKVYEVGYLSQEVINLLKLNNKEMPILLSDDKIKYISKHADEFSSYEAYKKCTESIHDVILYPDYVALHPNGKSIEFIKRIDNLVVAAVRIKSSGNLWIKTLYPISESKLNRYIQSGNAKKCF
jgi:hypothetical protein